MLGPATTDYKQVFKLWNLRLRSLVLAGLKGQASEEARILGDLDSEKYRLDLVTSIVPWDLRLLVTFLQIKGDGSASLAKFYAMAKEAIVEAHLVKDNSKKEEPLHEDEQIHMSTQQWEDRLRELGVYVAVTLVAVGDVESAINHLRNIYATAIKGGDKDKEFANRLIPMIALLYLQIGDPDAAREMFRQVESLYQREFAESLCAVVDADWVSAAKLLGGAFDSSTETQSKYGVALNNLAVVLVHQGQLEKALPLLERLFKDKKGLPVSLSNLLNLYELRYDVGIKSRKDVLASLKA